MDWSIFPAGDVGTLTAGLMIAGAVAGLAQGTLKLGGGLVLVPALYIAMKDFGMADAVRLPVAVATALAASVPANLSLLYDLGRQGEIDRALIRPSVWYGAGAAMAAGGAACLASGVVTMAILVGVALAAVVWLVLAREDWHFAVAPVAGWGGVGVQSVCSALGAFCGVGAGTPLGIYFRLFSVESKRAAATALAFDVVAAVAACAVMAILGLWAHDLPRYSVGYVNLAAFAVAAPIMFLAATFVHSYAAGGKASALRKIFALFVILSIVKMALDWLE